jgi:N-acetylglucosamine-6-phosphate deacetylase
MIAAATVSRATERAMPPLAIINATAILPDRILPRAVVVSNRGRIVSVVANGRVPRGAEIVDVRGAYVAPGFIDLHVHGGAGADFMDGTPAGVAAACACHLRHGTTTIFPTTTTGAPELIDAMLEACREAEPPNFGGVHLYGPYFASGKVGCHDAAGRRDPTRREYDRYFATGLVKIATCAAELPGAEAFYRAARRRRCLVTCGHSEATWTEMERAFAAGMRHVDHFWCAMSSVPSIRARCGTPMQGSMAEFVLANPEMSTEVLADGQHLAPELLRFAAAMLGPRRLCLVTDSSRAVDMPPGRYRFGHERHGTWFESDGLVGRAAGGLASGVVGMDHMVRHFHKATGVPLPDVVRMASLTPAERVGIAGRTGSLEAGKRADMLVLSKDLEIRRVFLRGREVSGAAAVAS